MDLTVLFRPVGQREYERIEAASSQRFPPRPPEQPFFYPVTNEAYATRIAHGDPPGVLDPLGRDGGIQRQHLGVDRVDRLFPEVREWRRIAKNEHRSAEAGCSSLFSASKKVKTNIVIVFEAAGSARASKRCSKERLGSPSELSTTDPSRR
jgi:hypothetical protein